MDRSWMHASQTSKEYREGVQDFINQAIKHFGLNSKVPCPCLRCGNLKNVDSIDELRAHLIMVGIDKSYTSWIWHGEINVDLENHESGEIYEDDRLEDMIHAAQDSEDGSPDEFDSVYSDAEKPLYPGCSKFTRLSAVLKLYNLKAGNGWSDKSFTSLLELLKDMLPDDNVLPNNNYEAKKTFSHMGMCYQKIHACPNDCILYRNEYALLESCPSCKASRYKKDKVPSKVLWYFPIIPRLKRMFKVPEDAKNLMWHSEDRIKDGKLRHPADSPQWRYIDSKYPEFAKDLRNLRFALSTDGMSPYGTLSSTYSVWPVLIVIYNLPPGLCMKRKYMMLSMLISGPKQPGNDIDVYLAPLVEDLKLLWEEGVEVFDAYKQEKFNLRAMLFCTINDFPAYGNLSGYTIKGHSACPGCEMNTHFHQLANKTVYMGGRRFLDESHRYRRQKDKFDGTVEENVAPAPLTGEQVYERVKDIDITFGKKDELGRKRKLKAVNGWKKCSIFFTLSYWRFLFVRHSLDVMHIEKNVCESVIGTLLNIPGKTKDGIQARRDLATMGIRSELHLEDQGGRIYMPPACYTLSKDEKFKFCDFLAKVKVPDGYSSNIRSLVSMNDLKLVGLKSHDCHILMQEMLPIALRCILPSGVRLAIMRLCFFFKAICSKVIDPSQLNSLQNDIIITLCELEMYFPPSFFDIMIHLVVHLVREVRLCGPVFLRWMYPFERYMKVLKGYVKNKNHPEGSIAERYIVEEAVEFCSEYLSNVEPIGLPKPQRVDTAEGRGISGAKLIGLLPRMRQQAHLYVLHNVDEVMPYIDEHKKVLNSQNQGRSESWIQKAHNDTFTTWFEERIGTELVKSPNYVSNKLKWLSYGPKWEAVHYNAYIINGYTFYTKDRDDKSPMQNSGVTLTAEALHISGPQDKNPTYKSAQYYGVIEKILELDYTEFKVPVFDCKWVKNSAINVDELGFTLVDLSKSGYEDDPFIFASQAKQVFFVPDPSNKKISVVLSSRKRYTGDELENDAEDVTDGSICSMVPTLNDEHIDTELYVRNDHDEGLHVQASDIEDINTSKKRRRTGNKKDKKKKKKL